MLLQEVHRSPARELANAKVAGVWDMGTNMDERRPIGLVPAATKRAEEPREAARVKVSLRLR
jgi:hypothetical protein